MVLIGGSIGTLALIARDDDRDRTEATSTTRPLTATARELLDLLDRRGDATYHARYEGRSPESPAGIVIESWQRPPLMRQDSAIDVGGQLTRTRVLVLEDRQVRCAQLANAQWTCRDAAPGEMIPGDPTAAVAARLAEADVTARDTTVGGRPARCFRLVVEGQATEMCVDASGIPLRVTAGTSSLELVALDTDVSDDVFEAPAESSAA